MGVSLTDLINDRRQIAVTFKGRTITLTYKPHSLNRQFFEEQRKRLESAKKNGKELTDDQWATFWFSRIVCGWDVTEGDGEAPITEDTLGLLGTRFLLTAIELITADLMPDPPKSEPSDDG